MYALLVDIANFNLIPTDLIYDWLFKFNNESEPYNTQFDQLGY
jgi:hypothetical protein